MDGKPIGLRKIDGFKFDARLQEIGDEGDISGEPVQFGNDQGGPMETAGGKCLRKLRTIIFTSAFDFGVFGDQFAAPA
jgi:hypothetical protein